MIRARRMRGYTLLEVAIVAVISSVLFFLGMRWVFSLSTASIAASSTDQSTQLSFALDRFEDDARAVAHCDPYATDLQVRTLTTSSVIMVVSEDGIPTQVSWRLQDGQLQRATSPCQPAGTSTPEEGSWSTLATGVAGTASFEEGAGADILFTPVRDGAARADGGSYDSCAEGCDLDAVMISLGTTDGTARTVRTARLGG